MLEYKDYDTTTIPVFEDFLLLVYVLVDDLYKRYAPPSVKKRRNLSNARLSDPEIISICICGEIMGIDSENAWYHFVKRNYRHLFPRMCSRTRFNRTRRNLAQTTEAIRERLPEAFSIQCGPYFIVDSFPLPVCRFGRAHFCRSFRPHGADYGRCPSKKETFFGFRVHAAVTLEGFVTAFSITPASTDDRDGLRDLADGQAGTVFIGDKGYVGTRIAEEMASQGICLMAMKRSNDKDQWPRHMRQMVFKLRRRVETVFSQLSEQLNAERVLAKSFQGLCTRLVNKILAHNLCMVLNHVFGWDGNIQRIKQLVF